jgi:GNAT superfamily N-acetyltransferase
MEGKVREYRPEDSVEVKGLILSILQKEYPFDQSAYQDSDINDITGTYDGENDAFFVVEKGGKIAGAVGIKKDENQSALVRRLFVDENHRRSGFGTMLLEKAIKFCKAKDYGKMTFRATDRMSSAMKLLKKMGFREDENLEVSGFHIHRFVLRLR